MVEIPVDGLRQPAFKSEDSFPLKVTLGFIAANGIPIVPHVHGGHTDFQYDGNPEFFFSPGWGVRGPQWVEKKYIYDNDQPAGNLWYHDHALGITRLNVYAGMAGFYFVRDNDDTGLPGNTYDLPAWPYEKAYAIQAGRELRVIIDSEKTNDKSAESLSFEITQKIMKEMIYPGQIKVTVIRETRAVNFAK